MNKFNILSLLIAVCFSSVTFADSIKIEKQPDVKAVLNELADKSIQKKNEEIVTQKQEANLIKRCNEIYSSDSYYRLDYDYAVRFVLFNFIESAFTYYCDQLSIKDNIERMYAFVFSGSPAIEKLNNLIFDRIKSKKFHLQQVDITNIKPISNDKNKYKVEISVKGQDLKDPLEYFDVTTLEPIRVELIIELEKVINDNINSNIIKQFEKSDIIKLDLKKSINPFNIYVKDFEVISK